MHPHTPFVEYRDHISYEQREIEIGKFNFRCALYGQVWVGSLCFMLKMHWRLVQGFLDITKQVASEAASVSKSKE